MTIDNPLVVHDIGVEDMYDPPQQLPQPVTCGHPVVHHAGDCFSDAVETPSPLDTEVMCKASSTSFNY
jgi:hypothetical protein